MTSAGTKKTKYDFLLALQVGESYTFENKPTLSEAKRKVPPSWRSAYNRISQGLVVLRRLHPEYHFKLAVAESNGSHIPGDIVVVTLLARGDEVSSPEALEAHERIRRAQIEAWRRRKLAEDAPKLPGQLAEASAAEHARRVAGAVRRQIEAKAQVIKSDAPRYDPAKIAQLVAAQLGGATIQRLTGGGWVNDPNPTWTLPTAWYRVKPNIREFYIVVARDGTPSAVAESIDKLPHHDPDCRVHVREVLPEEEETL